MIPVWEHGAAQTSPGTTFWREGQDKWYRTRVLMLAALVLLLLVLCWWWLWEFLLVVFGDGSVDVDGADAQNLVI